MPREALWAQLRAPFETLAYPKTKPTHSIETKVSRFMHHEWYPANTVPNLADQLSGERSAAHPAVAVPARPVLSIAIPQPMPRTAPRPVHSHLPKADAPAHYDVSVEDALRWWKDYSAERARATTASVKPPEGFVKLRYTDPDTGETWVVETETPLSDLYALHNTEAPRGRSQFLKRFPSQVRKRFAASRDEAEAVTTQRLALKEIMRKYRTYLDNKYRETMWDQFKNRSKREREEEEEEVDDAASRVSFATDATESRSKRIMVPSSPQFDQFFA